VAPDAWKTYPRTLGGVWLALEEIRERIDAMQTADEVAQKVAETLKARRMLGLTTAQKAVASAGGLVIFVSSLLDIISRWGH
jgi:hypothetical protein